MVVVQCLSSGLPYLIFPSVLQVLTTFNPLVGIWDFNVMYPRMSAFQNFKSFFGLIYHQWEINHLLKHRCTWFLVPTVKLFDLQHMNHFRMMLNCSSNSFVELVPFSSNACLSSYGLIIVINWHVETPWILFHDQDTYLNFHPKCQKPLLDHHLMPLWSILWIMINLPFG